MTTVKVFVTLKPGVLDPQGQAVAHALSRLGFAEVKDARIGKYIELAVDETLGPQEIEKRAKEMCERLLANTVIEQYRIELP